MVAPKFENLKNYSVWNQCEVVVASECSDERQKAKEEEEGNL